MPGGPVLIKILVVGTLLFGSMALLANILPSGRQILRSRKLLRSARNSSEIVTRVLKHPVSGEPGREKTTFSSGGNRKVRKTEEEWKAQLTDEQYQVARCGGTERPFTGKYWDHNEDGIYTCVGCGQGLFSSRAKYDSGSGWPSYTRPVERSAVDEIKDISYGMVRTEIVCSRCEAHLGHVFADGPRPAGLRYCINSAALDFVADGEQSQTSTAC